MEITKIRGATGQDVMSAIEKALIGGGFQVSNRRVGPTRVGFKVDLNTELAGHNISPHTGRKGTSLGWNDWVWVNNTINDVLDEMNVSANAQSLHGVYVIRRGSQRFGERDWQEGAWRNVGSMVNPVYAIDAWRPADNRVLPQAFKRGVRVRTYKRRQR